VCFFLAIGYTGLMATPDPVNDRYTTDPIRPGFIVLPSHKSQGGVGAPDNSGLSASGFNPNNAPITQLVDPDYPDAYVLKSSAQPLEQAKNKNMPATAQPVERRITDGKSKPDTSKSNNIKVFIELPGIKVPFRVHSYQHDPVSSSLWLVYVHDMYTEIPEFKNSEVILSVQDIEKESSVSYTCKYYGHKMTVDIYTVQMFVVKPTQ